MMITVDYYHFLLNIQPRDRLQFRAYDAVPSDQETIDLVGEGFSSLADTPQLVCKQFWAEASEAFFATATFNFTSARVFRRLTMPLLRTWVQRVRRLRITAKGYIHSNFLLWWAGSLTDKLLAPFTHLEGVEFRIGASNSHLLLLGPDIMEGKEWKDTLLPLIIRSFQQHKLKPELTRFVCEEPVVRIRGRQRNPFADGVAEAIRAEMLKYHPPPAPLATYEPMRGVTE